MGSLYPVFMVAVILVCAVLAGLVLSLLKKSKETEDGLDYLDGEIDDAAERVKNLVAGELDRLIVRLDRLEEDRDRIETALDSQSERLLEQEDWALWIDPALDRIEERLDRLEGCCGLQGDLHCKEKDPVNDGDRREERCLTGQCDPDGCERELCPHKTAEFTVSPFSGVLSEFDGKELEDAVLLQQPVEIDVFERPKQIDLADSWHHLKVEVEPAKQDTQPPTKASDEQQ